MGPYRHALLALAAGALAGLLTSWTANQAHADEDAFSVPVPSHGVIFRTNGGRAIARLWSDKAGGVFEVLDAREQVAVRLRATNNGGAIEVGQVAMLGLPASTTNLKEDPGY
ncbi:MAG TPA: hypothetical protein VK762_05840 [Polyangiaceae bacterium]|nr:hypothetical protein [Polyangiaceae bacterium]